MRNFMIGFFMIMIIVLFGVASSTAEGRTLRQNELDNSLGKAIEQTLSTTKIKKTYNISSNDQMIADAIQNLLIQMDSDSTYTVTIYGADYEKGILDVEVKQRYKQLFGEGEVTSRKTVVVDKYTNTTKEYVEVTFYEADNILKRISLFKGDQIPESVIPEKEGYTSWITAEGESLSVNEVSNINIMENTTFTTWDMNADYCAVTFYAANGTFLKQISVNKGDKIPLDAIPVMADGSKYSWYSYPSYDVSYTADELEELTINAYLSFIIH